MTIVIILYIITVVLNLYIESTTNEIKLIDLILCLSGPIHLIYIILLIYGDSTIWRKK